ncbi:MAG: PmoA family protein [Candidatus Brockarchaeota archaeon]|nr:PmoA family protein [Candidatus Brockarchaeota archaeon]
MGRKIAEVKIEAGVHERVETPVNFSLPKSASFPKSQKNIYLEIGSEKIPLQVTEREDSFQGSFILPYAKAGEMLRGDIVLEEGEDEGGFSYDSKEGILIVNYGKSHVTSYNYGKWLSKPYLYPIFSTNGVRVTEDGPEDHVHHKSLWVAHGDVNGHDFWAELENSGKIEARDVKVNSCGKVFFELDSSNVWITKSGSVELYEKRTICVWRLKRDVLIDVTTVLFNREKDTKFGDTKEGGILSIRVNEKIKVDNGGKIENSFGGINEAETWGKRAAWCDYSGIVDGKKVGITAFDHVDNFRYPTYWHVRNYGLMTANMFGISAFTNSPRNRGDYVLPKEEELRFKYRVLVHEGRDSTYIRSKYVDFLYPPNVKIST